MTEKTARIIVVDDDIELRVLLRFLGEHGFPCARWKAARRWMAR
jgi:FixJ family two-component response regulator